MVNPKNLSIEVLYCKITKINRITEDQKHVRKSNHVTGSLPSLLQIELRVSKTLMYMKKY